MRAIANVIAYTEYSFSKDSGEIGEGGSLIAIDGNPTKGYSAGIFKFSAEQLPTIKKLPLPAICELEIDITLKGATKLVAITKSTPKPDMIKI